MGCSQALLTVGFSRQEYWSGWPFPPPGDLPHPGVEPALSVVPALASRFFTTEPHGKPTFPSLEDFFFFFFDNFSGPRGFNVMNSV